MSLLQNTDSGPPDELGKQKLCPLLTFFGPNPLNGLGSDQLRMLALNLETSLHELQTTLWMGVLEHFCPVKGLNVLTIVVALPFASHAPPHTRGRLPSRFP